MHCCHQFALDKPKCVHIINLITVKLLGESVYHVGKVKLIFNVTDKNQYSLARLVYICYAPEQYLAWGLIMAAVIGILAASKGRVLLV